MPYSSSNEFVNIEGANLELFFTPSNAYNNYGGCSWVSCKAISYYSHGSKDYCLEGSSEEDLVQKACHAMSMNYNAKPDYFNSLFGPYYEIN